ncbi:MAG: hypothetical protein HN929_11680 [Chloroflexi bacterium]|nr:hypothetical protein [Chloroflexota bacterium]
MTATGASKNDDTAGGDIIASATTTYINGELAALDGDAVASHGIAPHAAPTMIAGSNNVWIEGKKAVNAGDLATCGHAASGSTTVFIGN